MVLRFLYFMYYYRVTPKLSNFTTFFVQAVVFHVEKHPVFHWFEQCVTFDAFPAPSYELAYNLAGTVAMYIGPLTAIGFCYGAIVLRLYRMGEQHIAVSFCCGAIVLRLYRMGEQHIAVSFCYGAIVLRLYRMGKVHIAVSFCYGAIVLRLNQDVWSAIAI